MDGLTRGAYPQQPPTLNQGFCDTRYPIPENNGVGNHIVGIDPMPEPPPPSYDGKWEIEITRADYGYIVRVGCKKFSFESKNRVLSALDAYLSNPEKIAKDFLTEGKLPL